MSNYAQDKNSEILYDKLASNLTGCDFVRMDKDELMSIQLRLGVGDKWGIWEYPSSAMPDGPLQHQSRRIIEIKNIIPNEGVESAIIDRAWTEMLRYGVVRSLMIGVRTVAKPTTIATEMKVLARFVRKIVSMPLTDGKFWSLLTEEEMAGASRTGRALVKTFQLFFLRGLLPDAPLSKPRLEGAKSERDRRGEGDDSEAVDDAIKYQPFPDVFTSECGWRSAKIITELGPTLLTAIESAFAIVPPKQVHGKSWQRRKQQDSNMKVWDAAIQQWNWMASNGEPLLDLGFDIELPLKSVCGIARNQKRPAFEWPPSSFDDAWNMLSLLQGAHLFPVCLASGPRASEVTSLNINCLGDVDDGVLGRAIGKTFKFADGYGGRDREFLAPELVVLAITQQVRLCELVKLRGGASGDHLWVRLGASCHSEMGEKHLTLTSFFRAYCFKLKLFNLLTPEAPTIHLHRFRKTLARVVALSLVNSPIILMDCFGHEDPAMTIRSYILSDKQIARDVLEIQRELVVMMAVDIIKNSDELGGAVGEQLRRRKHQYLELLGKSEFEPQDAYEFARRETFDGRTWMMVAPGVFCTLPTGEGGPCSKAQGGTNPAYCQSGCPFQLLTTYNKIKTEDAVAEILKNLQRAVDDEEPMLIAQWSGQLKNWLFRWEEIAEKWRDHPLVKLYAQNQLGNYNVA
jgi:integrase